MHRPDWPDGTEVQPLSARRLSPEARQQVRRAAFLRPTSLLVAAIGGVFFALTLTWWSIPLTLVIYAMLVFLAARDALFGGSVLEGGESWPRMRPEAPRPSDVSPSGEHAGCRVGRLARR